MLKKEYPGEVSLLFEGWFGDKHVGNNREVGFDQPGVSCSIL